MFDTYENNRFVFIGEAAYGGLGWKDIDINLSKQLDGDVKLDIDIEAINNSLENIMMTMQGSRRMLPEFATPIYKLLFEPLDKITAQNISNYILHGIERWDNRILIQNIDNTINYDDNRYELIITYSLKNRPEDETYSYSTILQKI